MWGPTKHCPMTHFEPHTQDSVHCAYHYNCLQDFSRSSETVRITRCFPLTRSSKCFPFVIPPPSESIVCDIISNQFKLNPEMSDERRSCQGKMIKVSLCQSLHINGRDCFPFFHSAVCSLSKNHHWKLKIASVMAQMILRTSIEEVILIRVGYVLYKVCSPYLGCNTDWIKVDRYSKWTSWQIKTWSWFFRAKLWKLHSFKWECVEVRRVMRQPGAAVMSHNFLFP